MSVDYLKVQGHVLAEHGPDAAILLALLEFRAYGDEGWVGTYADITDDTALTVRRIKVAAEVLRDAGLVETTNAGVGRTLRWWPKRRSAPTQSTDVHLDTTYRETNKTNTADAGDGAATMAEVTPIDGGLFPSDAVPHREPTAAEWANECRKAWLTGFVAAFGHDPHPDTTSRVFGHIKRACAKSVTQDHFRDVWRAARAAGAEGRWDIQVDRPKPRYERPHNVQLRKLQEQQEASTGTAALNAYYEGRELGR